MNPHPAALFQPHQAMRAALQRGLSAAAAGSMGASLFQAAPAQVLGLLHALDFTARLVV